MASHPFTGFVCERGLVRALIPLVGSRACKDGYYYLATSQRCAKCDSSIAYQLIPAVIFILVLIACFLSLIDPENYRGHGSNFRGSIKIIFTTFQILSFINADLTLPGILKDIAHGMEFLQVEIPWECLYKHSSYITRVQATAVLPIMGCVLIWLVCSPPQCLYHALEGQFGLGVCDPPLWLQLAVISEEFRCCCRRASFPPHTPREPEWGCGGGVPGSKPHHPRTAQLSDLPLPVSTYHHPHTVGTTV